MSIFQEIAKHLSGAKSENKITRAEDQTPDEKKLYSHIREKLDYVKQANSRVTLEGVYLTNTAYLLGFNGVFFDTQNRQFKSIDAKRKVGRNKFHINKILPTVQNRLARLTKQPPKFDVRPNSNSSEDKDAARLGLQIIEDIADKQKFGEKRQEAIMMAMQGGHSYIKVSWDPTTGSPMTDPLTGEFAGYEGDIRLDVLNCLEVFPDPLAKRLDDCQYIIEAKVRKLEYFRERWPEKGQAVHEEDSWLLSSIYDLKANSLGSSGTTTSNAQSQVKNSAVEIVYYEKRSKDHPNGRMVVAANGIVLEDKELPVGEFHLVKIDDLLIGGRFNSEAIITHLRPIQDQYSVARTKCADWIKLMLAGKYLVAKGANLSQESLNNDSGEVVQYTPVPNAPPPTVMPQAQLPSYIYKDIETLDAEFDFVSGINEVSRGELPSSSIPASGMAFLQEQDETRIGVVSNRLEEAYARVGCLILKYVGKFYEVPRLLKAAGDGLGYAVKDFVGSDLNENYDVVVIPGSTVPFSKTLKRQDISNAYQMGLLGDPNDPKLRAKVLKMMEFGDVAEMWQDQALDEQMFKKSIEMIENGKMPEAHELDNHTLMIELLNRYRKTDKYTALDEYRKQMFDIFLETHIQQQMKMVDPSIHNDQLMAQKMMEKTGQIAQEQNQMNMQQSEPDQTNLPQLPNPPQPQIGQ